jgi:hypothetical protein
MSKHLLVALALAAGTAAAQDVAISATVQAGRDNESARILARELDAEIARAGQAKDDAERERTAQNIAALKREIERTTGRQPVAVSAVAERRQKPAAVEVPPALFPSVFNRAKHSQEMKQ